MRALDRVAAQALHPLMFKQIVFLVSMSLPLLAVAEEVSPGKQALAECFKNSPNNGSNDVRLCIAYKAGEARDALQKTYTLLLAKARRDDLAIAPPFNVIESKLIESQQAFLEYEKKQCSEHGFLGAQHTTGTGINEGASECTIDLMKQRLEILNTRYLE